ncbi:MAG: DoxX family protein [Candidatus Sungiibacteriota bacterium]
MLNSLFLYSDWAPLVLRLMLGAAFMAHGYPKLFKAENRQMFSGWLESMGFKPGKFWALVVGVVEFYGGIALILGVYTQIAAILIAVNMLVAMWKAKWGKVGFTAQGGWELDLAYLVIAVSLLLTGAGAWSLDKYFLSF